MLKRVALSELETGMYVHKMLGGWLDHPFWKAKFLIGDANRLETLRASRLEGVIIDTAKGKDIRLADEATPAAAVRTGSKAAPGRIGALRQRKSIEPPPIMPTSTAQEVQAAEHIAGAAQKSLSRAFLAARLGKALNVRAVEPVVRDVYDSVRRNPQAFSGLMRCKLSNEFVYRHALAVSALMVSLAARMKLSDHETYQAGMAGLFLDIGTNYLPKEIAPANGDYRNAGAKIWEQHVVLGHRALENEGTVPRPVLEACLHHHERMDGTGFPKGLKADDIGQLARMAALCDSFDYMLTDSAGSSPLDPAQAVRKLVEMEGAFDPVILRQFIESVGLYPVGSFVRLRSERIAMVIDEDKEANAKPVVQAFYSLATGKKMKPLRIILADSDEEDEIVDIADLSGLDLEAQERLREVLFLGAHSSG
ncbi:MAG: DUF3391 domain-containing protein [Erythrobacter sp.]|nr:MAG: DUF3391 domain-containing protein [Erythrobacter sp.]